MKGMVKTGREEAKRLGLAKNATKNLDMDKKRRERATDEEDGEDKEAGGLALSVSNPA